MAMPRQERRWRPFRPHRCHTLHPIIVFGVWGWPEWAVEVPLEEILVIDIAGDPLEAKRFEEAAQMRCDPGIDFGVGLFALGHGRFHLLEGDLEGRAAPAEGQLGLGHGVGAACIAHVQLDEVTPAACQDFLNTH